MPNLWGFMVADYIEKSQPEYAKADRELRKERVLEGASYANFNNGTPEMQYVQTHSSRIIHKIVYIILTLVSLASIILGGFICMEAELTVVGIISMIASFIFAGFFLWWLGHQLLVKNELTHLARRLAVRNFRIASVVYATALSVSTVLNALIPVFTDVEYTTNMILYAALKAVGAIAIWAVIIIESRRRLMPL